MRKRVAIGSGLLLFLMLLALVLWQGSFTTEPAPVSLSETYAFWAVSTLIFILTVTLGFMLFRTGVKLYIERQQGRPGSRLRSKLVGGALALSCLPVLFLVLFSVQVLNRNIDKWFSRPGERIKGDLIEAGVAVDDEVRDRLKAQAHWLASLPNWNRPAVAAQFCRENRIEGASLEVGGAVEVLCGTGDGAKRSYSESIDTPQGRLTLRGRLGADLEQKKREVQHYIFEYDRLARSKNDFRKVYLLLLSLITLFVLFFATWIALFLARQISGPIAALLNAAEQVREGNLAYRVRGAAIDELAALMQAFNEMTEALEANSKELESRRRFTEAILESIPTGVVSLDASGRIQRVNRALRSIFPDEQVDRAVSLDDLLSREDAAEIRYLMNRARRTGVAGSQIEHRSGNGKKGLQLAATVAALEESQRSGFVLVLEDTTELIRAQKAAAWHEVARRVAHEIKNPLTPIALCADRIARQLERSNPTAETWRILRECSRTIGREVESVRELVDEFSQFSRFPAAQPALGSITVIRDLGPNLPLLMLDAEQFKRAIVNLVDNAAEAMRESPVKRLTVATRAEGEAVEVLVADTGMGISEEDKEKLFLPYFSTKNRGTGLGLAIVNRILAEHGASIRVEDNAPAGARFLIEIPLPTEHEAAVASEASA
jgi:two-component system nitrogen regulation sensor histidine kinase NtrY